MNSIANLRRIQNEIKRLCDDTGEFEKMFTIKMVGDNLFHWDVELYGPDDSLYEGYKFKLDIVLPNDYPFAPPRIKFITPIQHVNINTAGDICVDTLKNEWKASQCMRSALMSIILLLSNPNYEDPLNSDLAELYRKNKKKYVKTIKDCCEKHKF